MLSAFWSLKYTNVYTIYTHTQTNETFHALPWACKVGPAVICNFFCHTKINNVLSLKKRVTVPYLHVGSHFNLTLNHKSICKPPLYIPPCSNLYPLPSPEH